MNPLNSLFFSLLAGNALLETGSNVTASTTTLSGTTGDFPESRGKGRNWRASSSNARLCICAGMESVRNFGSRLWRGVTVSHHTARLM